MSTRFLQFLNQDGRRFHVRLVRKRERCGSANEGIHQENEPVVEFFDAMHQEDGAPDGELGYFTGIRCCISTLFVSTFEHGTAADQLFNEDLPMWNIDEDNLRCVRGWVESQLAESERNYLQPALAVFPNGAAHPAQENAHPSAVYARVGAESAMDRPDAVFLAKLHELIAALDTLESQSPGWHDGHIELRLALLAAKKHLLSALGLLHHRNLFN